MLDLLTFAFSEREFEAAASHAIALLSAVAVLAQLSKRVWP